MGLDSVNLKGEDGHANTYAMYGRRDAIVGAAKIITELEKLAYEKNGYTTLTKIRSGPYGACNIQSDVKLSFCLMNREKEGLESMGTEMESRVKGVAALHGLEYSMTRDTHLLPGDFWPEAIDCVKRACGDEGIGAITLTGHDSTMTTTLVPTAMVFARGRNGHSHTATEWTDKEDCTKGVTVLGRAVLNFDYHMHNGQQY